MPYGPFSVLDGNFCQLSARRPELMHMPLRNLGVQGGSKGAIRGFKLTVRFCEGICSNLVRNPDIPRVSRGAKDKIRDSGNHAQRRKPYRRRYACSATVTAGTRASATPTMTTAGAVPAATSATTSATRWSKATPTMAPRYEGAG